MMKAVFLSSVLFVVGTMSSCTENTELVFGDGTSYWMAPTKLAKAEKLFSKYGLTVDVVEHVTGAAAKAAVLGGALDVAMTASTPLGASVLDRDELRVIATYMRSDFVLKLVRLKETDDVDVFDIKDVRKRWNADTRVGYVRGTISEHFLDIIEKELGIEARRIHSSPPSLIKALTSGKVDFISLWEPYRLLSEDADRLCYMPSGDRYSVALHLVTRPDVLASKTSQLKAFVESVHEACEMLEADPERLRGAVEQAVGYKPGTVPVSEWDGVKFEVMRGNQPEWQDWLATTLRREASWLANKGSRTAPEASDVTRLIDASLINALGK